MNQTNFVCLFDCFEPQAIFQLSGPVMITGDIIVWATNLDLCLALTTFSSEGSFRCHTCCDLGPPYKVISERPVILPSECCALGEEAITTYFKRLRFDAAGTRGGWTHNLQDAKQEHYVTGKIKSFINEIWEQMALDNGGWFTSLMKFKVKSQHASCHLAFR
jgi:hypothetical protein